MKSDKVSRRQVLQNSALIGITSILGGKDLLPDRTLNKPLLETPPLTRQEVNAIEAALGKKGTYHESQSVHSIALPRNDLKVTIKGEPVPIALGFGGWVAFKRTVEGDSTVMMSDTVLLEEEVNPLISAAQANGLEVSAIHNHFFYEQPRIFYMHLHGHGSTAELAQKYAATIKQTKLFPANQTAAAAGRPAGELFDIPALDAIVKGFGAVNGPTYKYTMGRDDLSVMAMGAEMTAAIGLNSWASFAGTKDSAHIAGDIAMLEHEVNPVIKALRANGLEVVALHNHMLDDDPRIFFLHYYGKGPATQLAQGFRAALDELGKPDERPMKH
ncbi:DUF1259 domain-containing protein [Telluribacter sp. SYSU D00476]|uniref:DUF1259 domain-containing protein n=1 Tax=Telluribacter sp. SYSU D00476 TaxID=2811430 RepID=UPI001FF1AE0B|nr:DUF1259 domain-containing protein [Telluribacter sp. SYSU D00476]